MTERKFTDEEVIRALECCSRIRSCDGCPLDKFDCGDLCVRVLMRNALDLINRQKAEIEDKSKRLREVLPIVAELKAEAIKKFSERLKTYYRNLDRTAGGLVEYHIDVIAKEFLGGIEDSQDND